MQCCAIPDFRRPDRHHEMSETCDTRSPVRSVDEGDNRQRAHGDEVQSPVCAACWAY